MSLERSDDPYTRQTLRLLDELDGIIKECWCSGDPLRDRIADELIAAQSRIYGSEEWRGR